MISWAWEETTIRGMILCCGSAILQPDGDQLVPCVTFSGGCSAATLAVAATSVGGRSTAGEDAQGGHVQAKLNTVSNRT